MKLLFFLLLVNFGFSAEYLRVSKEYEIKEKPGTFIGPGYFYSDSQFKILLKEIAGLKENNQSNLNMIEFLQQKIETLEWKDLQYKEITKERQKIQAELDFLKKQREETLEFMNKTYKEIISLRERENRNLRFENKILKLGIIIAPFVGVALSK